MFFRDTKKSVNKKPLVAMLSSSRVTDKLKKNCAMISPFYECDFLYFTPDDVNFERNIITGLEFKNSNWIEKKISLQDIDIIYDRFRRTSRKEYDKLYSFLEPKIFTHSPIAASLNKYDVYELFKEEDDFKNYIAPYEGYNSPKDTLLFLMKHEHIILKPQIGLKGANLYSVSLSGNEIEIIYDTEHLILDKKEFIKWQEDHIKKEPYVLQKFINTKTKESKPFDIRVLMMKGESEDWDIIVLLPRIGIGYEKITLINNGGYISSWKPFVMRNFGETKYKLINKKIRAISEKMMIFLEEKYNEYYLSEAGIDFAISHEGDLYLLEVNVRSPGFPYHDFEVAKHAIAHAKYLYENK